MGHYQNERIEKLEAEIEKLRAVLKGVVADIDEYERVNNLHPNPGKSHCWESVRAAKAALGESDE